jgi:SNF2 family DNA or RNA helicase
MSTTISPYKVNTDLNVIYLWKNSWEELDYFVAECMGIDFQDGFAVIDPTLICPAAFEKFVKHIYKIADTKALEWLYKELMEASKPMYEKVLSDFFEEFSPRFRTNVKGYTLAKHQRENLPWFMSRKHNGEFWEQRAGKTITGASISDLLAIRKTIVVTSNTAKTSWYKELPDWDFPAHGLTLLGATEKKNTRALMEKFVLVNYDVLGKYLTKWKENEFGHIIFGECHKIKNSDTSRYKLCQSLVDKNPHAKITLETGTPVANRVNDLFAYLQISGHRLGRDYSEFAFWFLTVDRGGAIRGVKNAELLNTCLSNWWSRVLTAECFDLPKEQHEKISFEIGDYQEEYDRVMEEIYNRTQRGIDLRNEYSHIFDSIADLEAKIKTAKHHEAVELRKELLRLQSQNNDVIEQVKAAEKAAKGDSSLHTLNIITARSKMKGIIEFSEDLLENTGKLIIYCAYKEPLKQLQDHFGKRCLVITGDTPSHERSSIEDRFRDDEKIEVIIGTEAASESLDLSSANNTIIVSMPLSPRPLQQFTKRMQNASKTSDKQPIVTIHYMIAENTVDEVLFELVGGKISDIKETVDKGKDVQSLESIPHKVLGKLLENYKNKKNAKAN